MNDFRRELAEESDYPLSDTIFNIIMGSGIEKVYNKGELLISTGEICPDLYIIKSGVVKGYLNVQSNEQIIYFGLSGTVVTSMHSFSRMQPSVINIEACSKVTVHRITYSSFQKLMDSSTEFCRWICGIFSRRCYFQELKSTIMSGDSKWRYEWIKKCRPELLNNVSQKSIASYLGITEVHLSRIRKNVCR